MQAVSTLSSGSFIARSIIALSLITAVGCSTQRQPNPSDAPATGTEAALPADNASNQATGNTSTALNEQIVTEQTQVQALADGTLTRVTIEGQGASAQAVASMIGNRPYTLKRTSPSEYVLRIKGAYIAPETAQAVLSPDTEGAIRSIRPSVSGNDVVLRIFTAPQTDLLAQRNADNIVVSASSIDGLSDVRAQVDAKEVAKVEEGAEKAAEPTVTTSTASSDLARFLEDTPQYTGRLISLDLQDTDIDNALRIIAEVSNLNIIASGDVTGKVTLRLIDVPWDQALDVILKTNNLDKVQEGNVIRIAPVDKLRAERESLKQAKQAEEELEPLQVKYIRVSYARASELKPLIDNVVTERGAVTYDERTNQIIVKDIGRGIKNVAQLISKLDLRTPQVLLETQIVQASRTLLRDLGSQLNFRYVQSPATGNATGVNFPNSTDIGGVVAAPAANAAGNAISMLFGSADGTKTINETLTAYEKEGRVRVISRPAVATTNNKAANIKSVRKLRIRLPSGGVSVATGQGAQAAGQAGAATETVEAGIVLDVTPQASPDYFVLLDIRAKSSSLETAQYDQIPIEAERSASSTVLVSSGQTFALGGIYRISDDTSVRGWPFFKDIPFFGTLFRNQLVSNEDEELLFFITPRIVEGSFDDATMKAATL